MVTATAVKKPAGAKTGWPDDSKKEEEGTMAEILNLVDIGELRKEVREEYREVAQDPTAGYHFHPGRAHALRLGYPPGRLDQLPEDACESFAGVGNPFYWGGPASGERVVDLGSGAGMDSFLAALGLDGVVMSSASI